MSPHEPELYTCEPKLSGVHLHLVDAVFLVNKNLLGLKHGLSSCKIMSSFVCSGQVSGSAGSQSQEVHALLLDGLDAQPC